MNYGQSNHDSKIQYVESYETNSASFPASEPLFLRNDDALTEAVKLSPILFL